ncbi:MAG TPA: hypothetical protein DEA26_06700 [Oceanospirillales bacterium]|nr:hypothetical protein [Oceanospirillaceae bacterium]HBS42348.1 hypothetical protein [Oceanospirillales bacterium]
MICIDQKKLDELLLILPSYDFHTKRILLLELIFKRTGYPGAIVEINFAGDVALVWASKSDELKYYLASLVEDGFITKVFEHADKYKINFSGLEYLKKYQSSKGDGKQCFVAMSFSPGLLSVYENGIKPAIEDNGFISYRVDADQHVDRIDAKIVSEIKKSKFMVADVTEQKSGVYYEAGFAHGLGIPVIWCVRDDDLKNVHFDTRQYNHIVWKNEDELREKLTDLINVVMDV